MKMVQYYTEIDEDKCTFCITCVVACPQEVIEADYEKRKAVVVDQVQCVACLNCENVCLVGAVKIIGDVRIDWKIPSERWPELHNDPKYVHEFGKI